MNSNEIVSHFVSLSKVSEAEGDDPDDFIPLNDRDYLKVGE